ncbi:MAG: hypothetical protein HYV09_06765 [Deltaproteobacteria bacterium]|nr:hypothetical protein [Deltaproteobacteria bacterium]
MRSWTMLASAGALMIWSLTAGAQLAATCPVPEKAAPAPPKEPPEIVPAEGGPTPTYDPRRPVPRGYHVEERPDMGLVNAGAVVAGVGTVLFLLSLPEAKRDPDNRGLGPILAGGVVVTGVALVTTGLLPRSVLVPNKVAVAPAVARHTLGGAVAVQF